MHVVSTQCALLWIIEQAVHVNLVLKAILLGVVLEQRVRLIINIRLYISIYS